MTRTLPGAVRRGLADTVWRGDVNGVLQVAAIGLGLTCAAFGYLHGWLEARFKRGDSLRRSSRPDQDMDLLAPQEVDTAQPSTC